MSQSACGTSLSAFWPFTPFAIDDLARWSELAVNGPYSRLWIGQSAGLDVPTTAAYAAGAGRRFALGIAVNVIPMHNPVTAAQQARAMALALGHDLQLCFSPGDPMVQRAFAGSSYSSPLSATREFLTAMRGLTDAEPVHQNGEYFPMQVRLPGPSLTSKVRLGLGTLRPRMTRLAGEIADTATTWLTPPKYVRDVIVPALTEGAGAAGRVRPRLVVPVHASLCRPGRDPGELAEVAVGTHVRLPHYQAVLAEAGDAAVSGTAGALKSGLFLYGSAEDIADRVVAVAEAGADEIALVLHHPPQSWQATCEEWFAVGEVVAAGLSRARRTPDLREAPV